MSCGPSKALSALADKVDLANEKIDELILQPTIGKLDDLKQQAEDELNGLMGDLEEMIPEIDLVKIFIISSILMPLDNPKVYIDNKTDNSKEITGFPINLIIE